MKILLVTDAWQPQINGVVFTIKNIIKFIQKDHEVLVLHPNVEGAKELFTIYHDIPLVKNPFEVAENYFDKFKPETVHIATEGCLGVAARSYCLRHNFNFNTSYHTKLDDYGWVHYGIPKSLTRTYVRWFHGSSRKVLVTSQRIAENLGLNNCTTWGRGVDTRLFNRQGTLKERSGKKTIIYVGRASRYKNPDDFCRIKGYQKIFVGDGPYLDELKSKYHDVHFVGFVPHNQLAGWYKRADVFVFPSKMDTFGLVILEAMACGLPVVAYNVPSPSEIVKDEVTGYLVDDLKDGVIKAFSDLERLSENAADYARSQSWKKVAHEFVGHLLN